MFPSSSPYQIAFVEPTGSRSGHLRQLLEFEGIDVSVFGPEELPRLRALHPDLVVFNQSHVRRGTLAFASQATGGDSPRPLTLALVAQGDEISGIELVEHGLDAYIATPCGSREFVARVRALLRRSRWPGDGGAGYGSDRRLQVGDLDIDPLRRRARVSGVDLRLTEQEFQLLYFLAGNPDRVFDRQALLDAVWGTDTFVTIRSVDALVKRLRHQLRSAGGRESAVETVRGVGYRFTCHRSFIVQSH